MSTSPLTRALDAYLDAIDRGRSENEAAVIYESVYYHLNNAAEAAEAKAKIEADAKAQFVALCEEHDAYMEVKLDVDYLMDIYSELILDGMSIEDVMLDNKSYVDEELDDDRVAHLAAVDIELKARLTSLKNTIQM